MIITQLHGRDIAEKATGCVVVIDVLRAFTTAAYAFVQGAAEIFIVSTTEEAFSLKEKYKDFVLVGEVAGKIIEGFDFGNSPEQMEKTDLSRKRLVLGTGSGAQAVVKSVNVEEKFLGSFVVAEATAAHLLGIPRKQITLFSLGAGTHESFEEDIACGEYLEDLLLKRTSNIPLLKERVIQSAGGKQALDPLINWKTPRDFELALQFNRFDFVMPVRKENGLWIASALPVKN